MLIGFNINEGSYYTIDVPFGCQSEKGQDLSMIHTNTTIVLIISHPELPEGEKIFHRMQATRNSGS